MILDAPAQYDHPYAGQMIEHRMTAQEVERLCRQAGWRGDGLVYACAFKFPLADASGYPPGFILIPNNVPARTIALLERHERGHCNGWKH